MAETQFWDERFADAEYAYGTEPNAFFRDFIDVHTAGELLLPAEGEGRNAVYAAKKGWLVDAFDFSRNAMEEKEITINQGKYHQGKANIIRLLAAKSITCNNNGDAC